MGACGARAAGGLIPRQRSSLTGPRRAARLGEGGRVGEWGGAQWRWFVSLWTGEFIYRAWYGDAKESDRPGPPGAELGAQEAKEERSVGCSG